MELVWSCGPHPVFNLQGTQSLYEPTNYENPAWWCTSSGWCYKASVAQSTKTHTLPMLRVHCREGFIPLEGSEPCPISQFVHRVAIKSNLTFDFWSQSKFFSAGWQIVELETGRIWNWSNGLKSHGILTGGHWFFYDWIKSLTFKPLWFGQTTWGAY